MVQVIEKQGNVFGQVGRGFGQGLAEQIPKEIERNRLRSGLQELSQKKDLTPFQRYSELVSIPGISPQAIQSGGELLTQEARGQQLANRGNNKKQNTFPKRQESEINPSRSPSLTKAKDLQKIQEGYIPPTIEERDAIAGEEYNKNPAFFSNNPEKALEWADKKIAQDEKINLAYQNQHQNLTNIQDNVVKRLGTQSDKLNTKVPSDLYSIIEDEAINATKPLKEGGEGLTEQESIKKYGEKLNQASKTFNKVNEIGNWEIVQRPAKETLRSMKEIQKEMRNLGQTDNYAKKLISENKVSPQFAYAIAEPVHETPKLNSMLRNLPDLERTETLFESKVSPDISIPATLDASPGLAKFLKDSDITSPMAIAHELDKKGYDSSTFLKYVSDHAKELNLRKNQIDQLSTPRNLINPLNDWWLSSFTGIE